MSIQVFPQPNNGKGFVEFSSVVITTGASLGTGTPAEGFYGTEYTINKTLPIGTYAYTWLSNGEVVNGRLGVENKNYTLANTTGTKLAVVSSGVSSYKYAVASGWKNTASFSSITISSKIGGFQFGNGLFVLKGDLATTPVIVSTDGVNWATATGNIAVAMPSTTFGNQLSFTNGYFIFGDGTNAVGRMIISTDGMTWTSKGIGLTSAPTIQKIAYNNGYYFAMGSPYNVVSTDFTTWASRALLNASLDYTLKTINDLFFIGIGSGGNIYLGTNGTNWVTRNTGGTANIFDFAYGNGTYVVVGASYISISTNLTTWTIKTPTAFTSNIYSVHYANGYFMTVGNAGGTPKRPGSFSSTDGNVWTSRSLGQNRDTAAGKIVLYGNNIWLAVADTASPGYYSASNVAGNIDSGVYDSDYYGYQAVYLEGYPLDYTNG